MTDLREAAPERVVLVLFQKNSVSRSLPFIEAVTARGVRVTALVADGLAWSNPPRLPADVEVYSLARAETRRPFVRTYTALVERLPGGVLRRLETHLPGLLGRAAGKAHRLQRKVAGKLRKRVFWPVYRPLRSHALRRAALRRLGPLELGTAARLVCADDAAVPLAWALTKRHPGLPVTRSLHLGSYQDHPVIAPPSEADPDGPAAAPREPYTQL
jgi:hypothetical protein